MQRVGAVAVMVRGDALVDRFDVVRQPPSLAFAALLGIVERTTRRRVVPDSDPDIYSAPPGTIEVPQNDTEALLHELAHWVMAGPSRRDELDYGVHNHPHPWDGERQEIMCGWLQADLCARAGIERPRSSVDAVDFAGYPWLRVVALARWRRYVGWQDRLAVVEALRMPGGDVGLWSG